MAVWRDVERDIGRSRGVWVRAVRSTVRWWRRRGSDVGGRQGESGVSRGTVHVVDRRRKPDGRMVSIRRCDCSSSLSRKLLVGPCEVLAPPFNVRGGIVHIFSCLRQGPIVRRHTPMCIRSRAGRHTCGGEDGRRRWMSEERRRRCHGHTGVEGSTRHRCHHRRRGRYDKCRLVWVRCPRAPYLGLRHWRRVQIRWVGLWGSSSRRHRY